MVGYHARCVAARRLLSCRRGPYRFIGTVGNGDVPAAVIEAFRRLAEYMAAKPGKPGATSEPITAGSISLSHAVGIVDGARHAEFRRWRSASPVSESLMFRWPWQKTEKRSAASGFTAEIIAAREAYVSGRRGIAELTATAQCCVSLWEQASPWPT